MGLFFIICGEFCLLFAIIIMFFCEDDLIRFEDRAIRILRGKIKKNLPHRRKI